MISAISLTGIILIVIGVLLFIVAAYLVACYIGYYLIIVKPPRFDVTKPNALIGPDFPAMVRQLHIDIKELKNYHSEPITVVTADGLKLYGYFYRNPKETKVTIVCLHGYNSTGYGDFGSRALGYLKLGYNVLIVNHRHSAKSEGKCTGFGVLDRYDVPLWLDAVNARIPDGEIFISGLSMGGALAMQVSCMDLPKNVKAIIEDCGFTSVKEVFEYQCRRVVHFVPHLTIKIIDFYMRKFAGYGADEVNSVDTVKHSKVPIFFIHGDTDYFVPTEMVFRVYDACTTEKELYLVKDCGHAMSEFKDPDEYFKRIDNFIRKYSDILKEQKQ